MRFGSDLRQRDRHAYYDNPYRCQPYDNGSQLYRSWDLPAWAGSESGGGSSSPTISGAQYRRSRRRPQFPRLRFFVPIAAKVRCLRCQTGLQPHREGNHRLFLRGALNSDRSALSSDPPSNVTGDGGSQFPGDPPNREQVNASKGLTVGYTATISNTLINDFRFGYIRQALNVLGLQSQQFVQFRALDNLTAQTPTTSTSVPVKNWVDDLAKIKGNHTLEIGINLRQIDNIRESNSTSYFTGLTNSFWLAGSCISNCGTSLDPAAFGFPAVDNSFATGYDFPVTALAGLVTQVGSNYNLTKTLTALPEGAPVPRHFHDDEWEWYGQDSWHVKPNLTMTYGLRYTLLLAPYETNGQEVVPTFSLSNWFNQRAADQVHGETYDPLISFGWSGRPMEASLTGIGL